MSVPDALRWQVFRDDGFTCRGCGAQASLEVGHIVPRCDGGSDERGNLQTLCRRCNARKGPHRPGRHRPTPRQMAARVGFRVSRRERVAAETCADELGLSTSEVWRTALAEFLASHGPVRPMSDDEMEHIA